MKNPFRRRAKIQQRNKNTIYTIEQFFSQLRGVSLQDKTATELEQSFRGWTYSAVMKTASRVASTQLKLYRVRGNKKTEITSHYILDLLQMVNPIMNGYDLKEATTIYLELVGSAYWLLLGEGRYPSGIWVMDSARVLIRSTQEKIIDHYEYLLKNGEKKKIPPEKVVRFAYTHPMNPIKGYSPAQASSYEFDILNSMNLYEKNLFDNFGQLGGIIYGAKNVDEIKRLKEQWKKAHQGVEKTGLPEFLVGDLKYEKAQSIKDLLLDNMRKVHREELLGVLGVPPSKLGLTEHTNRANAETNDYTFNKEKIEPILKKIESKLNEQFTPIFGNDLILKFENIIPADKQFNLQKNTLYVKNGIYTINEVREEEGKPPVDWGDEPPAPKGGLLGMDTSPQEKREAPYIRKFQYGFDKGTIIWNKYLVKHKKTESKLEGKIRAQFNKQQKTILKELFKLKEQKIYKLTRDEIPIDELLSYLLNTSLYDTEAWEELFNYVLHPDMASWITATGERFGVNIDIGFTDPAISGYLNTHIPKVVGNITNTTRKNIEQQIKKGYENGESIEMMANRIRSVFNIASTSRARTIARTETTGASNYGILKGFEGADVEKKIWITARDELVRTAPFDHTMAEGETVYRQDYFTATGEPLSVPGDSAGSPGNIINCRCTMDGE